MIDLCKDNPTARLDKLVNAVDDLENSGNFEFVINEDPTPMLQEVWKKRTGRFQCELLEQGTLWRVRVTSKRSCCGGCH